MLDNIKSKIILKIVMEHLRQKLKLKIVKNNKKLINKLNLTIKDFQRFEKIRKLSAKYGLQLKDEGIIKTLNFKMDFAKNAIWEDLIDLKLDKLEVLNLNCNEITTIDLLEKVEFQKLKILILSNNKISDIKVLEKVEFKELKNLNLETNCISNINVLENVKFEKLEVLNISENKIADINNLFKFYRYYFIL